MSSCCAIAPCPPSSDATEAMQWLRVALAALVAGLSMMFGLGINLSPPTGVIRLGMHLLLAGAALIVFLLVGLPVLREAIAAARARRIVVEQLFLAGIVGAFGASLTSTFTGQGAIYYEVVSVLLAIYTFGRLIGDKRRQAALSAARSLEEEFATAVRLTPAGVTETVSVRAIRPGDTLLIPAGENITIDGVVCRGTAFVRETSVTGEAFPVVKRIGDSVWAGSQVLDETLTVEASVAGTDRHLDHLLFAVEQAQKQPGPALREADRLVAWFLPAVLAISTLTFLYWTFTAGWTTGLFCSMAVLLVACPCAVGLATPIAIWSAINQLARRGLVAQSGELVERLAAVTEVVFDKTGTLSEAQLLVVDFCAAPGIDRARLQDTISAMEAGSSHPVARAFHLWPAGRASDTIHHVQTLPGVGMTAHVTGLGQVQVGNSRLIQSGEESQWQELRAQFHTRTPGGQDIYIRCNDQPAAMARLAETLRDKTDRMLELFRELGVPTRILTGDTLANARSLGLEHVEAGLIPEQKAARIRQLQHEGRNVLFVGDGINDASAMATANVSIALTSGAGLCRATAHAQLYHNDLGTLPAALVLARKVRRGLKRNLLFAAVYNVVGISLAATGLLHPVVAALLMLAASTTVTWRALHFADRLERPQTADALLFAPPTARQNPLLPLSWVAWVSAFCLVIQGPLLSYLGHATGTGLALLNLLFVTLALITVRFWRTGPPQLSLQMLAVMAGPGNLGMLIGGWADAGFGSLLPDGPMTSCCAVSPLLPGWSAHVNWMNAGMILTSFPAMFVLRDETAGLTASKSVRGWHAFWGTLGMLIGMGLASHGMSTLLAPSPQMAFYLHFGAMTFGMLLGMFIACLLWRRRSFPGTTKLPAIVRVPGTAV